MKFKYVGQLPIKDADLVFAGIYKPKDIIKNGDVFEVPDDDKLLVQRVSISGVYEPVEEKKVIKPKKEIKKEKEEEEK